MAKKENRNSRSHFSNRSFGFLNEFALDEKLNRCKVWTRDPRIASLSADWKISIHEPIKDSNKMFAKQNVHPFTSNADISLWVKILESDETPQTNKQMMFKS